MYPPLAATLSTHIVKGIFLSFILFSCEAAKPCSWTVPPEFSSLNKTSSPFLHDNITPETSLLSETISLALIFPLKSMTNNLFSNFLLDFFLALMNFLKSDFVRIFFFIFSYIESSSLFTFFISIVPL